MEPTKVNKLTYKEAMALPRHERRRLAKLNGFKIEGSNDPVEND